MEYYVPAGSSIGLKVTEIPKRAAWVGSMVELLFSAYGVASWFDRLVQPRRTLVLGSVFALLYGTLATAVSLTVFSSTYTPRFSDIFLIGVLLTSYLYCWQPAAVLFLHSLLVTAYVLPPAGDIRVASPTDIYRILSYAACCLLFIGLMEAARKRSRKSGSPQSRVSSARQMHVIVR